MNKENNPANADANADDDDFEDFDFDDEEEQEQVKPESAASGSAPASAPAALPTAAPTPASEPSSPAATPTSATPPEPAAQEHEEPIISPSEIPMILTIEVGRIQMTADYLFHLQQGNTLKLPSSLESGVWLCINGKRVGRGELVRIGDVVGVRVLELGRA
jgi:flagellar motor switch protein FliN/FliY